MKYVAIRTCRLKKKNIYIFSLTGCRFKSSSFSITRRLKWTVWWCGTIATGKNVGTRISGNCFLEQGLFLNFLLIKKVLKVIKMQKKNCNLFLNFLGGCRQSHWGLSQSTIGWTTNEMSVSFFRKHQVYTLQFQLELHLHLHFFKCHFSF